MLLASIKNITKEEQIHVQESALITAGTCNTAVTGAPYKGVL